MKSHAQLKINCTPCVTGTLPAFSPTSLTSLLTNLTYQPPYQPHLPASSPTSSPTSLTSLLTNLLYQPPYQPLHQPLPLAISKVECKAKDHVYIWDLYPTIREGKLESSSFSVIKHRTLSPNHLLHPLITYPTPALYSLLVLPYHPLLHYFLYHIGIPPAAL